MSGALTTVDDRAALLAMIERGELATALDAGQIKALQAQLEAVVSGGESFQTLLAGFSGPERHGLPGHLSVMSGVGIGYLRHCRDVLAALRRSRAQKRAGRKG